MKKCLAALMILSALLCGSLPAYSFQDGDWYGSVDNEDFYFAMTVNEAGHILGQYCYFENSTCLYLIDMGINCDEGHEYPSLINSSAGSSMVNLVCSHKTKEGKYVMAINSFDDIDRVIRSATRIGFAVPLADGQFKVSRFSLSGSVKAIDRMLAAAQKRVERGQKNLPLRSEERL